MNIESKAEYDDLVDAWWKTADALDARPPTEESRINWHAHVFERILVQCGWSVQEWNEITITMSEKTQKQGILQ